MQTTIQPARDSDCEFAFKVKAEAMRPYIEPRWGWDRTFQYNFHLNRWQEKPWSLITKSGKPIGTVSINPLSDHVQFGEFYLLESQQRKGFGTVILNQVLADCDRRNTWVRLEYLKWNPVGSLYRRHGFTVSGETEIHYLMERKPISS